MVQGENASLMFKSNGCDQGVNGGERYAFSARCAIDCSRGAIGFKAPGLQHVPLSEKQPNSIGVPDEALQDLGYHYSSERERFAVFDHPA